MSVEKYFSLTEEQKLAIETVVLALKKAVASGAGVAAITFAIEDANCGLADLMSHLAYKMYLPDGLLSQRCAALGAAEHAKELGQSVENYMSDVRYFAQKDYKI